MSEIWAVVDAGPEAWRRAEMIAATARRFLGDRSVEIVAVETDDRLSTAFVVAGPACVRSDALSATPVAVGNRVWAAGDIRLDNRGDVCELLGWRLPESTDIALVVEAYERWGVGCFRRLVGDFFVVLWNTSSRTLIAARDAVGQRVGYMAAARGVFVVGSHPLCVAVGAGLPLVLNKLRVGEFLVDALSPTTTYFEGVSKIDAGVWIEADAGGERRRSRYWSFDEIAPLQLGSAGEYHEAFLDVFTDAVDASLRRDAGGGVGVLCSGGLDSTAVAGVAATRLAATGEGLTTYTSVPLPDTPAPTRPGWEADESDLVRDLARFHGNIDAHFVAADRSWSLDRIIPLYDSMCAPIRNVANRSWIEAIVRHARDDGNATLLSGQMGNATISHSGAERPARLLAESRLASLLVECVNTRRAGNGAALGVLRSAVAGVGPIRRRRRQPAQWRELTAIDSDWIVANDLVEAAETAYSIEGEPRRALLESQRSSRGVVRSAFRSIYGVSIRDPTGDRRVIEFCLGVPLSLYGRRGRSRLLIRDTMGDFVPDSIRLRTLRGAQAPDDAIRLAHSGAIADALSDIGQSAIAGEIIDLGRIASIAGSPSMRSGPDFDYAAWADRRALSMGLAAGVFIRWFDRIALSSPDSDHTRHKAQHA